MKKTVLALVCLLTTVTTASAQTYYEVVPLPQSIEMQKGEAFIWNDLVQILAPETLKAEAEFLQAYLKDITGTTLPLVQKREKGKSYIELSISPNVTATEGYVLTVNKKGISIAGGSAADDAEDDEGLLLKRG